MGKSNGAPNNASSQTKNYEITLSFWGDGGIVPFEPFFSCFSRGSGESRNQKEEHEIIFPFRRDQEIGSSRKKNAWYKSLTSWSSTLFTTSAPDQ